MAEENREYRDWLQNPPDLNAIALERANRQLIDRMNRKIAEDMAIPRELFEGEQNYSSYAAATAMYGPSPLKSAAEIMQALKDSGAANVAQDSRLRRGAYLVIPPDTYHQMKIGPVFTEVPEVEDGPIRFRTFMDYGVRMPVHRSMLLSTCGDIGPYEPSYKPRPLPDPVQKVPVWQYVVAVAAGVLILSMMFSAVGAL